MRKAPKAPAILKITARARPEPLKVGREPFVAGKLHVRFKPSAARAVARSGRAMAAAPPAIDDPLRYLEQNCGLKKVTATFAAAPPAGPQRAMMRLDHVSASVAKVRHPKLQGFNTLTLDPKKITPELLRKLKSSPGIEVAERVANRWLLAAGDPSLSLQWGLWAIGWNQADRPSAKKVHVAVIDSGIDATHPDLAGAIESYIHTGNSARDFIGHGSHVSGIIAAVANNGIGICGVADARIHMFKMFDDPKGSSKETEYNDENYMSALNAVLESDIPVINLSIGGTEFSETEAEVMKALVAENKLVIAAMGNEFEEGNPTEYPAAYPGVLAVGAITEKLKRASFSNTGKHIGICAPGDNILSTVPRQPFKPERPETNYAAWPGTSMATPHVVGAAALLFAKFPKNNGTWVKRRLQSRAQKVDAMKSKDFTKEYGFGLVNVKRAL
jgi:subtilisin family serine protease